MSLSIFSPEHLPDYLSEFVCHDSVTILGYQCGSQPVCLFSSSDYQSESYMTDRSYAFHPFYSMFSNRTPEGIFQPEDIVKDEVWLRQFRAQGKQGKELAISIDLDPRRRVVIIVRREETQPSFSYDEKLELRAHFEQLKIQCWQLWPEIWSATSGVTSNTLAGVIHQSLNTFGLDVLTNREREIAALMIQGSDNNSIAEVLEISVSTVKVHRKSLYNKFEISSVGELFELFLNHLVLFSSQQIICRKNAA